MQKLPRTKLTLKKRADTLRTLIRQAASDHKLQKAALRVRDARIQVLRAKIGELSPTLFTARQNRRIEKLRGQIESLLAVTPEAILTEFRRALPKTVDKSVCRESRRFSVGANPTRPIGRSAGSNQGGAGGNKCVEVLWCNGSLEVT